MKLLFFNKILISVVFLLISLTLLAQTNSSDTIPLHPDVVKKQLANGFTYFLQQNSEPGEHIHFEMHIKAGSILETEEQRGFAHFLEHMVFNGSEHFPDNSLIDYFQTIGVEFGADINAYTAYDETVYMLPLPNGKSETLDKAFHFWGDILNGLTLSTEDMDSERNVIYEEWRTTIGLDQRLKAAMYPLLYKDSRYLHRMPIGLMDVVTKVGNDEELRKFYRSWYRPDLATLMVVGDFDIEDIEQRIKSTFEHITVAADAPKRTYYTVPTHKETLVKVIQDEEITSTSVRIVRKIEPRYKKTMGDLKRSVADMIYTYMLNQRLADIAQEIDAPFMYASSYPQKGIGARDRYTSFASVKGDEIMLGTKGLLRELLRVKKYGFTQEEFDRKKLGVQNDVTLMINEGERKTTNEIMSALSSHIVYGDEYTTMKFMTDFMQEVLDDLNLDDVHDLIDRYVLDSEENLVIIVSAPNDIEAPSVKEILMAVKDVSEEQIQAYQPEIIDEELMVEMPKSGKIIKEEYIEEMDITTIEFANGASIALKPTDFKQDEIRISSLRNGGYSLADDDNFDNASMAATLVNGGGLAGFTSIQLDQITSGKQVYIAPYIHRYTEGVSGFSSKTDFETLLQLNYLTYTAPRKDEQQFKIFIDNKKEYNRNTLNNPDTYFADELNKVMMQNSPRTATLLTPEQLDKIDLDKAFDFYNSRYSSAYGTRFFLVGSFDVDSIKPLITQYIGGLPGDDLICNYFDRGIRPSKGPLRHEFPRNKVEKTKVLLRFTGDYPSSQEKRIEMNLLSDILTIRLNQKLREEIGGVYSPYSAATILQDPNESFRLDIYFTCAPQNVDMLIDAALEEVEKMKKEVNPVNLDKSQKAWLKHREGSLRTNGYWRKVLEDQWTRGEDERDFAKYAKQIQDVSHKDISILARKYLIEENLLEFILSPSKENE